MEKDFREHKENIKEIILTYIDEIRKKDDKPKVLYYSDFNKLIFESKLSSDYDIKSNTEMIRRAVYDLKQDKRLYSMTNGIFTIIDVQKIINDLEIHNKELSNISNGLTKVVYYNPGHDSDFEKWTFESYLKKYNKYIGLIINSYFKSNIWSYIDESLDFELEITNQMIKSRKIVLNHEVNKNHDLFLKYSFLNIKYSYSLLRENRRFNWETDPLLKDPIFFATINNLSRFVYSKKDVLHFHNTYNKYLYLGKIQEMIMLSRKLESKYNTHLRFDENIKNMDMIKLN